MNRGAAPVALANPVAKLSSQFQQEQQQPKGPLWRRVIRRPTSPSPPPLQKSKSDFEQWRMGLARRLRPEPKQPEPEIRPKPEPEAAPKPQPDRKWERKPEIERKPEPEKKPDSLWMRKQEPGRQPEPLKKPEPEKKPEPMWKRKSEPIKKPELETRPEPEKKMEPERKQEPLWKRKQEPEKKPEPEKRSEVLRKPEVDKKPEILRKQEPEKKPEIQRRPEPEKKPEPERKTEILRRPELERKVEPIKKTESFRKPEPEKKPEPIKKPEPTKKIEPERRMESLKKPEVEKKPEPIKKPETQRRLEPEKKPEPVKKLEVPKRPEPEKRSDIEKKPELVRRQDFERKLEPAKKPEVAVKKPDTERKPEPEKKLESLFKRKPEFEIRQEPERKLEPERKTEPLWKRKTEMTKAEPLTKPVIEKKLPEPAKSVEPKKDLETIWITKHGLKKTDAEKKLPEPEKKPVPIWKRKQESKPTETPIKNITSNDSDDSTDSDRTIPESSKKLVEPPKKPVPLWKRKQEQKQVEIPVINTTPNQDESNETSDSECDLLCPICHELYDSETEHQLPVLLPRCGHTFCRACLLKVKGKGHFPCPTCCKRHFKPPLEDIAIVEDILKRADAFREEKLGHCEKHGDVLGYWCQDCRRPLCGSCRVERGHNVMQTRIVLKEKRDQLTQQGKEILASVDQEKKKILESVKTCSAQLLKVCEASAVAEDSSQDVKEMLSEYKQAADMQFLLGSLKRMKSILSSLKRGASSISASSDTETEHTGDTPKLRRRRSVNTARYRSKSSDNKHKKLVLIEEMNKNGKPATKAMTQPTKKPDVRGLNYSQQQGISGMTGEQRAKMSSEGPLLGVEASALWPLTCCVYDEDGRRARVAWEDGRLHMWALGDHVDDAHFMIKLAVLQSVIPQDNPEVFMDLSVDDRYLGRFYVRLWGHLRRAHNFLALCMGTHGPSYRGAKFEEVFSRGLQGECLHGGPYPTPEGNLSAQGVMDNLEWDGKFKGPQRERLVVGAGSGRPDRDACFDICTIENKNRCFACPFGEVVDGWDVVLAARDHRPVRAVTMLDVGVVIPDFSAAAIAAAST